MNFIEGYLLWGALLINMTWLYFCAIMRLQQIYQAGQLNWALKLFAIPNLLIGAVLDTALNWFVMSVVLVEFPRECLTTTRLCRWYEQAPTSWRGRLSAGIGSLLLNPIDPSGRHVK